MAGLVGAQGSASEFQVVKGFQVRQYGGPLIRVPKIHGMY